MTFEQEDLEATAEKLGALLRANGYRLATAESCTGGWVAECVTSISGSSDWFDRGFVTYSNEAKQEMLAVSPDLIRLHGVVSEPVVVAMAEGALRYSRADCSVAISGIAGPNGGSLEKPVGSVCFAWANRDGQIRVKSCYFAGDRRAIRSRAVDCALRGVIDLATLALV